ncbi:PRC-barrel domain-containing protein [Nafulsella turpanensis]|uniref:PRC-barrel domain-containing protein n=1 Tax=Nafulsella turpanensis TaxID=1265690 RepID=UPI00034B1F6A|nr:PRC-barrel domain-containing protein [Nafulsella turpanensis]
MMESAIFSFKNFENRSILDRDGDKLGEVHDVVLNIQTGEIAYVLLASGGFLGIGEKYFPVPYEALRYHAGDETYRMNISKDKLEQAPSIEIGDWPNRPDRKQVEEVYTYYGYQAP